MDVEQDTIERAHCRLTRNADLDPLRTAERGACDPAAASALRRGANGVSIARAVRVTIFRSKFPGSEGTREGLFFRGLEATALGRSLD